MINIDNYKTKLTSLLSFRMLFEKNRSSVSMNIDNLKVSWECPSNIALVKYWGKKEEQLPLNPSLSFSLKKAHTRTTVTIKPREMKRLNFRFEGEESSFAHRVDQYLDKLSIDLSWINDYSFYFESENTFPHSAGIASSASAFGSFGLCMADINHKITGKKADNEQFLHEASRLARLGSGSACRSVYPGFAWWGKSSAYKGSTDCFALHVNKIHDIYSDMCDAVLIISSDRKKISSSAGHALMNDHLYREIRIRQANSNAIELYQLLKAPDHQRFFEIIENEALTLHALMMSSMPSFILLKEESLKIMDKIRMYREDTGIQIGFTMDAGPNIHLLYFREDQRKVHQFIESELKDLLEEGKWLDDRIGEGPVRLI